MLTYTELMQLRTFEERLNYLRVEGIPSELTFGPMRYINQRFYNSKAWKRTREQIIARDLGFDLAVPGRDIPGRILVHHMVVLRPTDIALESPLCFDPEFLITVSHQTHLGIHFGSQEEVTLSGERFEGDTKLW